MLLEKAKSAVLMALFAICVYLAGQFLLDTSAISARTGSNAGNLQASVHIEDLLNPQGIQVSFGGGLYSGYFDSTLKNSLWASSKGLIRAALETAAFTEVEQMDWDAAVVQRGVAFKMPFGMTVNQILIASGSNVSRDAFGMSSFDVVLITVGQNGSVYLGNRQEDRYIRFSGEQPTEAAEAPAAVAEPSAALSDIVSEIENAKGTIEYKRIEDIFSLREILEKPGEVYGENHIIEPIVAMPALEKVRVGNEFSLQTLSEEQERYYAYIAFGSRFDFVKRVREVDGSVVYLYGYGDRALRFGSEGQLEYEERFESAGESGEALGFKASLAMAAAELRKYGEFPEGLYLRHYSEAEEAPGVWVKTFQFGIRYKGLPVDLSSQSLPCAATVEITNDQLTYLTKNYKQQQRVIPGPTPTSAIISMDKLIEYYYDQILKDYLKMKPEAEAVKEDFGFVYQLLHDITDYELIYFLAVDGDVSTYVPAWHLGIGSNHYYFDFYTGRLLQHLPEQVVN
jgi:hypothetical protein